jgi:mannose-6-phosphate isomerase-like protein (cupin superfamily)
VTDIKKATLHNHAFRVALWTGSHLQLTLMAVPPGEDIGLEMHPHVDQLLCVQQGQGVVLMGEGESSLHFKQPVFDDCVMIIPAGKWHNIINTGCRPLKLYSVYAPPNHPWGTVHVNKSDEAH